MLACRWERKIGDSGKDELAPQAIERSIMNRNLRRLNLHGVLGHNANDGVFSVDEQLREQLSGIFSAPRTSHKRSSKNAGTNARTQYLLLRAYLNGERRISGVEGTPEVIYHTKHELPDFLPEHLSDELLTHYSRCYDGVEQDQKFDDSVCC